MSVDIHLDFFLIGICDTMRVKTRRVSVCQTEILSRRAGARSMTTGRMARRAMLGARLLFLLWRSLPSLERLRGAEG